MIACRVILVGFFLIFSQTAQAEQQKYPKTQEALFQAILKLNWETEPKEYSLAGSRGKYLLSEGLTLVRGEDAKRFMFLNQGTTEFKNVEAVAVDWNSGNQLIFMFIKSGYVKDDNWGNLDKDLLLEGIIETTEKSNQSRISRGFMPIENMTWAQEPTYEKSSKTSYWALKFNEGKKVTTNAIALKLGRNGFSELIWVAPLKDLDFSGGLLREALNNYKFEKGFRYADFSAGDKIAAFGIASLVAVTAGSKSGKGVVAGIIAMLLIFAKKLWFIIFVVIAGIWAAIKRLFRRG